MKVLEEDDGSGWIKIFKESTETSGLVPASYLRLEKDEDSDEETLVEPKLSMPVPGAAPMRGSHQYGEQKQNNLSFFLTCPLQRSLCMTMKPKGMTNCL